MWFIIKDLIKKNEQQEKRIQKLERVMNKDIKNVNILDWLNKNDKGIEIDSWLKTRVNVTLDDLYMIFNTDYCRGLSNILTNNIVDTKKKERYYKYIETNIISLTKQNLNDMAKFKFYI